MEFMNLADVTKLDEVPEGASVLAATSEGDIVRVPGDGLGGSGDGVKLFITTNFFDHANNGVQVVDASDEKTYSCASHSFHDAVLACTSGKPVHAIVADYDPEWSCFMYANVPNIAVYMNDGGPSIGIDFKNYSGERIPLYWDGEDSMYVD